MQAGETFVALLRYTRVADFTFRASAFERHPGQVLKRCPRSRSKLEAPMDPKFATHADHQHSSSFFCRTCGCSGKIVWEDVSPLSNSMPELVGIDGPFFERVSKKPPFQVELICQECGAVAATAFPSTSLHETGEYN